MPWTPPADAVSLTVITASWANTNVTANLRWLRLLLGNADPPGSSYVPVSASPTSVTWAKVPGDALAAGAAVTNLGYTPVNRAGDSAITGTISTTGALVSTNVGANAILTNGGMHADQSITAGGNLSATGSVAAGTTVTAGGNITSTGGDVSAQRLGASFTGPNALVVAGDGSVGGALSVTGRVTAAGGFGPVASNGIISTTNTTGSSIQTPGGISASGNVVSGAAFISTVSPGTAPLQVSSPTLVTNLNAHLLSGRFAGHASGEVPWNDGALCTNLNAELLGGQPRAYYEALAGGGSPATIPAGMIAAFATAAEIPIGWSRYTAADGRYLVGAGTASGVTHAPTFTENTNAGASDWEHVHASNSFAVGVSVSVSGSATGGPSDVTGSSGTTLNGRFTAGGANALPDNHTHSLNGVSFAVSGSGSGTGTATGSTTATAWTPPARAVVWARKN